MMARGELARWIRGMVKKRVSVSMLALVAAGLFAASAAQAALIATGDVVPADFSTWAGNTNGYIGNTADGTLTFSAGSTLPSQQGFLGYNPGVTGTVVIDGAGSAWNVSGGSSYIGYSGTGSLTVINGGAFTGLGNVVGWQPGSSGSITATGTGSSFTSKQQLYVGGYGYGTLTVNQGASVNVTGTTNSHIFIGAYSGSTGVATVDGTGSKLSVSRGTIVGWSGGTGSLIITNNGAVSSALTGTIGSASGSAGKVVVDGAGSVWNVGTTLAVGSSGTGRLSISDGGAATASTVSINSLSALTVDLGKGSSFKVGSTGTGTITNNGKIRLVASAAAANGTYTPMSYGTMSGTSTIQALGGIWDATNHTVTVTSAIIGVAGSALTADLATTQRFLFTDGASGKQVGAAFQAATSPTNLTLTATSISGSERSSLQSLLGTGESILSGWDFNATEGYAAGDPAYLSLFAGSGHSLYDLTVWHYDGSAWSKFDASDLAYDQTFASFTATGLSGFAVSGTAPVPIPPAVFLFGSGLSGLFFFRRRKSQA